MTADLQKSRSFYETVLGAKTGRITERWLDLWLFGTQMTIQQVPPHTEFVRPSGNFHLGATLSWDQWERERDRLSALRVDFMSAPAIDDEKGQAKLYLQDPDGYVVELKAYKDLEKTLAPPA